MGQSNVASVVLRLKRVSKSFGGLRAVREVDLDVAPSEIVGLIGPNGAGKTTLFNLITGYYRPSAGQVFFQGQDITRLPSPTRWPTSVGWGPSSGRWSARSSMWSCASNWPSP
jgi:ABC-type branched-subunit amino acid transport system ATPase component